MLTTAQDWQPRQSRGLAFKQAVNDSRYLKVRPSDDEMLEVSSVTHQHLDLLGLTATFTASCIPFTSKVSKILLSPSHRGQERLICLYVTENKRLVRRLRE